MEQGKLVMWIDMFSSEDADSAMQQLPKRVDISPRKPKKFQLRVIVYNTQEVILDDVNYLTGERASDIYVRGYMCDRIHEAQKTDTHFRSLTGEGFLFLFFSLESINSEHE